MHGEEKIENRLKRLVGLQFPSSQLYEQERVTGTLGNRAAEADNYYLCFHSKEFSQKLKPMAFFGMVEMMREKT